MITVISNEGTAITNGRYNGLSLSEACDQMVFDVYQTINEFTQDTLLTEHAFLLENGCEIEYVDEAGDETKEGTSFKTKIVNMIHSVGKFIKNLWEKLISWFTEKVAQIHAAFVKAGINKKHLNDAVAYYNHNGMDLDMEVTRWVEVDLAEEDGYIRDRSDANARMYAPNEYYTELARKYNIDRKETISINGYNAETKNLVNKCINTILEKTGEVIKKFKKEQKDANDALDQIKKNALSTKADNTAEIVQFVKSALASNSNICKDKIKIYSKIIVARAQVAKEVIKAWKGATRGKDAREAKKRQGEQQKAYNDVQQGTPDNVGESFSYSGKFFSL